MPNKKLLAMIVCPKCKGKIQEDEKHHDLICLKCQLAYPVRDGIPIMLVDEARPLGAAHEKP